MGILRLKEAPPLNLLWPKVNVEAVKKRKTKISLLKKFI